MKDCRFEFFPKKKYREQDFPNEIFILDIIFLRVHSKNHSN